MQHLEPSQSSIPNIPFVIRAHRFDDGDYNAQVALHNTLWQEYPKSCVEVEQRVENARATPEFFHYYCMVEAENGAVVAMGSVAEQAHAYRAGAYMFNILVHPRYQQCGIGGAVYAHLLHTVMGRREPPLLKLLSATRNDRPHAMRFLEKRGFTVGLLTYSSELAVADFDLASYTSLQQRLQAEGIEIASAGALAAQGDDWQRNLWQLHQTLLADVPAVVPYTPIPFEEYAATVLQHPAFHPDACFIARVGNAYVGMSYLLRYSEKPQELETDLSGVLREYRRRGIVTALKVASIAYARRQGVTTIMTMNEAHNPMYQLNLQLGFTPLPSWMTYQKTFASQE